jgi:predicted nucleotide-binding protein
LEQKCVCHNQELAELLAHELRVTSYKKGEVLIEQGSGGTDVCLILAGAADIVVNGRVVAQRKAGHHVGEMAAIDPSAPRCASVVAREETVVLCLSESRLVEIADEYPFVWRHFAACLGERLRERNKLIEKPNDVPYVFIGCSAESLPIAEEIQTGLDFTGSVNSLWTQGLFEGSSVTINVLLDELKQSDFAVLLLTADDKTVSRKKQKRAPRDNVIFELGLFMGELGLERTLFVRPRDVDLKIPTDLLGVTPITYEIKDTNRVEAALGPVCSAIKKRIKRLGPK